MTLKEKIISLSGDDYRIIRHCSVATQNMFFVTGLSVPVVFLLSMVSAYMAFHKVFNIHVIVALLALLFSWIISNIYRLLLYTTSKNSLPHRPAAYGTRRSRIVRAAFVCFIAFIISKPFESLLYERALDRDIFLYKAEAKKTNREKILFYYNAQASEINRIAGINSYGVQLIAEKQMAQDRAIKNANKLVDSSALYMQRLCFLCVRHTSCWLLTVLFILCFMYPVWLKYKLRESDYYELKCVADKRKVDLNYYAFRKKYASFFAEKYHRLLSYSELYSDAPYNTLRKKDHRKFMTQNDLISEIYDA